MKEIGKRKREKRKAEIIKSRIFAPFIIADIRNTDSIMRKIINEENKVRIKMTFHENPSPNLFLQVIVIISNFF